MTESGLIMLTSTFKIRHIGLIHRFSIFNFYIFLSWMQLFDIWAQQRTASIPVAFQIWRNYLIEETNNRTLHWFGEPKNWEMVCERVQCLGLGIQIVQECNIKTHGCNL